MEATQSGVHVTPAEARVLASAVRAVLAGHEALRLLHPTEYHARLSTGEHDTLEELADRLELAA